MQGHPGQQSKVSRLRSTHFLKLILRHPALICARYQFFFASVSPFDPLFFRSTPNNEDGRTRE
jgi:hypothetical protein